MRESIGGSMIFWIVLFLFSIFITFIAFIIKYARVYKIKNSIVNYIVKNEGVVKRSDIENKLIEMNYQEKGQYKVCRYFPSDLGDFYYIELYSNTEFPIIGKWLHYVVTIKGETRIFNKSKDNIDLNHSNGTGTDNDNVWFSKEADQCYLCVLKGKCKAVEVE